MGMISDWPSMAACQSGDPDALFVQGAEQNVAKRICRSCPVRFECLADALDNRIEFGVWGGMTERERRALLRRHPNINSWWNTIGAGLERVRTESAEPGPESGVETVFAEMKAMADSEFIACYDKEFLPLVRFVMKHGVSEHDAFDAAQHAFVEAYRVWEQIESPGAWLRKVAIRALRARPEQSLTFRAEPESTQPNELQ